MCATVSGIECSYTSRVQLQVLCKQFKIKLMSPISTDFCLLKTSYIVFIIKEFCIQLYPVITTSSIWYIVTLYKSILFSIQTCMIWHLSKLAFLGCLFYLFLFAISKKYSASTFSIALRTLIWWVCLFCSKAHQRIEIGAYWRILLLQFFC